MTGVLRLLGVRLPPFFSGSDPLERLADDAAYRAHQAETLAADKVSENAELRRQLVDTFALLEGSFQAHEQSCTKLRAVRENRDELLRQVRAEHLARHDLVERTAHAVIRWRTALRIVTAERDAHRTSLIFARDQFRNERARAERLQDQVDELEQLLSGQGGAT